MLWVGETSHLAADSPNKEKKSRYNKQSDKKYKDKKRGEAHLGQEWQSDSDSDDDDDNEKKSVAAIAIQETSSSTKVSTDNVSSISLLTHTSSSPRLFANLSDNDLATPTCLMAKGDKVQLDYPTSTTSERNSDDEDDENYASNLIKNMVKLLQLKF